MTAIATLIPVYARDHPGHFREALASIGDQRLRDGIESRIYLGVDGPIGEPLEQVVAEFRPRLHRVVRSSVNRGLAANLNALVAALQDEAFVFRMDADDVSLPTRYQDQLDYMAAHPEVDILGTAITEFGAEVDVERVVRFARGPEDALDSAHKRVPVAHPTVCIRRRVFAVVPGYPEHGTNEDVALWFACMKAGLRFDNLADSLLRFRIGPGFWRRRGARKAWTEFIAYMAGIYGLHGPLTLRYLYPIARLMLRLAPGSVSRSLYGSRVRGGAG